MAYPSTSSWVCASYAFPRLKTPSAISTAPLFILNGFDCSSVVFAAVKFTERTRDSKVVRTSPFLNMIIILINYLLITHSILHHSKVIVKPGSEGMLGQLEQG